MVKVFRFDNSDEFSSNTYVIGEIGKPCIVIDLGSTSDRVIKYIKDNHLGSCFGVLLTHGHFDHIRGLNKFFKEFPNTTLFIDKDEVEFLTNTRLNCSSLAESKVTVDHQNIYLFDDQDEIGFYNNMVFKVIETPFHTKGSVCFLYEKENALFTGDTLFKSSIGRTDLPTSSERTIQSSLNKLKVLDPKLTVYPGHGETTTLERESKYNLYLR